MAELLDHDRAEVCSTYHSKIAKTLPLGFILTGYVGDVFGYLPSDRQIAEGGYEVDGFRSYYCFQGRFKEKIENAVSSRAADLLSVPPMRKVPSIDPPAEHQDIVSQM